MITLPNANLRLTKIKVLGGATPGTFALTYRGAATAHWASPISRSKSYYVNWPVGGSQIPAALQTFNGGIAAVELTFSEGSAMPGGPTNPSLSVEAFRAVRGARTAAGAESFAVTVTYDVGPNMPKRILLLTSASAGRWTFPATGALVFQPEDTPPQALAEWLDEDYETPDLPPANTLVLTAVADAALTHQALVYY